MRLGDLLASVAGDRADFGPETRGTAIALREVVPPVSHPQVGASPQPAGAAAHRRVLVVDDDPRCRAAVARLLTEEGYDATVAADGEEASGLLASWHPDLVLTDLNMPRLDGRGLLQRVKALL